MDRTPEGLTVVAHQHSSHYEHPTVRLTSDVTRRVLAAVVIGLIVVAVVGAVLLRPASHREALPAEFGFSGQHVHATATDVYNLPCNGTGDEDGIRCIDVGIELTSGPTKGERGSFQIAVTDSAVDIDVGDKLVVEYLPDNPPDLLYFFVDFQRGNALVWLVVLFAAAVVALGRWQGLRALLALGITGVVLVAFAFPSILDGHDPTAVALVAAVLIAVVALYFTHGVTEMITVALLGTLAALGLTAVLAVVFSHLAHFTGFGSEDAFYLQLASAQIDVKGLVLAGVIIGSLGVLDDVTVTQVSAVWQLRAANPAYTARQLYGAAVTIGRDHIASTINTLVLAYAGASLPLLLIFASAGRSLAQVAVGELVAVEIVRTLVGSIGLVAAIPVTTALAALVVTRSPVERSPQDSGVPRDVDGRPPAGFAGRLRRGIGRSTPPAPRVEEPGTATWDQFAPGEADDWQ